MHIIRKETIEKTDGALEHHQLVFDLPVEDIGRDDLKLAIISN